MTPPSLALDCTELFGNPVGTGIQRVVRHLIRHWPQTGPALHVARFDPAHGLVRISDEAVAVLQEPPDGRGSDAARALHARLLDLSPPEQPALPANTPVLVPEVFYERARVAFYQAALRERTRVVAMLAYDFIPYLNPWLFDARSVLPLMDYLQLMTAATDLAFISEQTRREYTERIVRDPHPMNAGPVLQLGSDGLRAPKESWNPGRDSFVCIGTIERRKNLDLVVQCFQDLWRSGCGARLVLVGHHFGPSVPSWLLAVRDHPNFTWLDAAPDEQLTAALRSARATIFVSETEGFGLPPVESLHVGIPVIAYDGVPSLERVTDKGQLRLPQVTPERLKAAVSSLLDDTTAEGLWQAAGRAALPTWATFAEEVATWCLGFADRRGPG